MVSVDCRPRTSLPTPAPWRSTRGSPRLWLQPFSAALLGALPLTVLGAVDLTLEALHQPDIASQPFCVLLVLAVFLGVAIAAIGVIDVARTHIWRRGMKAGEHLTRAALGIEDEDDTVDMSAVV